MSLIEDAKALYLLDPAGIRACPLCRAPEGHTLMCPIFSLPRIVAALEAAQQMLDYIDLTGAEYAAKYGQGDDWWTEWPDEAFVLRLREAMRAAP